jgi:protein-tyrosine phosphatase
MGKSRSVAVILVYLMKYKRMSLKNSIDLVKEKRHIIKPNSNYMKQLEKLEHLLKQ